VKPLSGISGSIVRAEEVRLARMPSSIYPSVGAKLDLTACTADKVSIPRIPTTATATADAQVRIVIVLDQVSTGRNQAGVAGTREAMNAGTRSARRTSAARPATMRLLLTILPTADFRVAILRSLSGTIGKSVSFDCEGKLSFGQAVAFTTCRLPGLEQEIPRRPAMDIRAKNRLCKLDPPFSTFCRGTKPEGLHWGGTDLAPQVVDDLTRLLLW